MSRGKGFFLREIPVCKIDMTNLNYSKVAKSQRIGVLIGIS